MTFTLIFTFVFRFTFSFTWLIVPGQSSSRNSPCGRCGWSRKNGQSWSVPKLNNYSFISWWNAFENLDWLTLKVISDEQRRHLECFLDQGQNFFPDKFFSSMTKVKHFLFRPNSFLPWLKSNIASVKCSHLSSQIIQVS